MKLIQIKKRIHFSLKTILFASLVFFIAIELVVLFAVPVPASSQKNDLTLHELAVKIYTLCKKEEQFHSNCYDREIPKLMDSHSMEQAFAVTKIVQDLDSSYTYCHVLGHKLSAREVAKDPSKWKEVVTRCPSGVCSNGCIHGGFEEKFRKQMFTDSDIEKYKPDLAGICEERDNWHPTGVEQASCYHAVGHLTMYVTNGDLQKATDLCDMIAITSRGRDFRQLCYDGTFMQIFQPLDADDLSLIEGKQPTNKTVRALCDQFTGEKQGSCVSESWPLFRRQILTAQGFTAHCMVLKTEQEQKRCYNALTYIILPNLNFDLKKTASFCSGLSENLQKICYKNAATRLIETDYRNTSQAVHLCAHAALLLVREACFEELAIHATYYLKKGSSFEEALCNSLPSKWKKVCMTV